MALHNDLGKRGEEIAADYLISKGHAILARNYRCEKSEVDIISVIGGTIVFTEVKTRRSDGPYFLHRQCICRSGFHG